MTDGVCKHCGTLHLRDELKFVVEGTTFVRRPRMATGPAGWKFRTGENYGLKLDVGQWLCFECRGEDRPVPPTPLWRQAQAAWGEVGPELRKYAPRGARR